jgi:DNA-binding protein HU-beta
MNKATLALKISEKIDVPKKTAEDFIATFQEIVTETLGNDEDVTIAGFGTFSSRIRAARKGVNPRNPSETIQVPAVKVPKFKAGKALKDSLKASMHSAAPSPASDPAQEAEVEIPEQETQTNE